MGSFDYTIITNNFGFLLSGIWATLTLSLCSIFAGMIIGTIVGAASSSKNIFLKWPAWIYVEIFRNIPVIILIFWVFYALPVLLEVQLSRFFTAFLALSFYAGALNGETWRSGFASIGKSQREACRALGFGFGDMMRYVILPQAWRNMFPSFVNIAIDVTKMSTVASVIAYKDLLHNGQVLALTYYRPIEAYTGVAIIFVVLIAGFAWAMQKVEHRLTIKQRR